MKNLLLLISCLMFAGSVSARTLGLIAGGSQVCVGDSVILSDTSAGGIWTSSNTAVATIGSVTGLVKGLSAGAVNITYAIGASYVTEILTVNPLPLAITGPSFLCTGSSYLFSDPTSGGEWSTSNLAVASVGSTSGVVACHVADTVTLIYTLSTGCRKTSVISVNSTAIAGPSNVCLDGSTISLSDATVGGTWSTSNPSIAVIGATSGILTGVSAGSVIVSYNVGSGCSGVTSVTVRNLPSITPSPINGCVGSSLFLTGSPYGGSWSSSNPGVATVNFAGNMTTVAAGTSIITYTASGGCVMTTTANVSPVPAAVTGPTFVYSGFAATLGDLTGGGVWSSSNPSLATIDPATGVYTGVAAGLVVISYTIPATGCASTYLVQINPLPATANLQAWYPFCGDTTDWSLQIPGGGGHDLLNHIGTPAVLAADRFGTANNAYYFGGGLSIMEFSTFFPNSGLPPDFTYSCWIKPTVAQNSIVMYNGDPNSDGFGFVINDGSGFPAGAAGTQVSVLFGGVGQFLTTDLSTIAGTTFGTSWYNLVLVKNGGSYHFYINDDAGAFFIATFNPMSVGSHFALGNNEAVFRTPPSGALGYLGFIGSIDDVALIDRQLSNAERLSLYFFNPDASTFTLGRNDTVICADYMYLSPKPQTIGGQYTWEQYNVPNWDTINRTDTIITIFPQPVPAANQFILHISKPYGCSAADTITIYKSPIPVNLGASLQNFCEGDTITLSAYYPRSSFLWSTGDTTHYLHVTQTGTYYLQVDSVVYFTTSAGFTDSTVCVGRDTVHMHKSTIPVLSVPANIASCNGLPDTVSTHADAGYTYLWSTGSTTDTAYILTTGTYWLQVTDSGCSRADTFHAIIVADTATMLNVDTAICKGDQVNARATFNPLVSYQWTPTAYISSSTLAATTIIPDTSAEYYLTVRFLGCANKIDSFHIDVQPRPTNLLIGGNRDVCEGDTLHITAQFNPNWYSHYIYVWSPINADLNAIDSSTVVFTALTRHDSETLVLKMYPSVFLSNPADSMCYAMDSTSIYVHPKFHDSLAAGFALCPGDSMQLMPVPDAFSNSLGVTVSASHWSPGTYMDDSNAMNPWIHPITDVTYRLIAFSQFGCRDTVFTNVTVYPAAVINLGDSVILTPGQSHQISPQTNCSFFLWNPSFGLDQTTIVDPVATPVVSTTYSVTASTSDGCVVTDSIRIHVDELTSIAIPNAFTPGASVNSTFKIIYKGAVELNYFRIFDRWGNKVFETTNIDAGWDGKFNGTAQPFGVYVYDVEAISSTGQVYHRVGNVNLIR